MVVFIDLRIGGSVVVFIDHKYGGTVVVSIDHEHGVSDTKTVTPPPPHPGKKRT